MRYWVYINEKVEGPYEENDLVTIPGFTPETLICTEESASSGEQEWKKANTIFEFDEVPVETAETTLPVLDQSTPVAGAVDTAALLEKLNSISSEMSSLQSKLDSMQTHLDSALEQNKQLTQQAVDAAKAAARTPGATAATSPTGQDAPAPLQENISSSAETPSPETQASYPAQAEPEEEEVIIRSALDSIYGGKTEEVSSLQDDTIQDLLPHKEPKSAEEIGQELEFIPLEDTPQQQPAAQAATSDDFADLQPEALITTPSMDEAAKDALISELTASPKEDILDQIIQEHQSAQPQEMQPATPQTEPAPELPVPADEQPQEEPAQAAQEDASASAVVLGAAAVGVAAAGAAALFGKQDEPAVPAQEPLDLESAQQAQPLEIAPDKNNPDQLEPVLPAQEMPQDVPAPQEDEVPAQPADLPGLDNVTATEVPETSTGEEPAQPADLPGLDSVGQPQEPVEPEPEPAQPWKEEPEDAIEELVVRPQQATEEVAQPADALVSPSDLDAVAPQGPLGEMDPAMQEQPQQPAQEVAQELPHDSGQTPLEESVPVQEQTVSVLGDEPQPFKETDLAAALAGAGENTTATETLPAGNPNDLTEIELKEGSTYLISDFVPPAQFTDDVAAVMNSNSKTEDKEEPEADKKKEVPFQDMMAATLKQSTAPLATEGLPEDVAAMAVNLENTIQAKRGASLDIKTVPMVPEPGADRLEMSDLNDINAQHDLKTSGGMSAGTKAVIGVLVGLLLLAIVYAVTGLMHLLPDSVNLFASKKPAQTVSAPVQEMLPVETQPVEPVPAEPSAVEQAQEKVQQFPLPNGYKLQGFIESKHSTVTPDQMEWTTTDAVEADNYSVVVKVPPENPQSLQTAYRFNYNMTTGILNPTNSDAKNLLDQAYGAVQTAQPAATKTATKTTTRRTGTNRRTTTRRQ